MLISQIYTHFLVIQVKNRQFFDGFRKKVTLMCKIYVNIGSQVERALRGPNNCKSRKL